MAIYEAKVVEQYINEMLDTNLAVEAFCEVDNSLQSQVGDTIEIWRYSDTGAAEKVAYGEGNTGYSDIDGIKYEYKVGICQDRVKLYDEDIKKNPTVANAKMKVAPAHLINTMKQDVVNEWYKTTNVFAIAGGVPTVAELVMAQADLDLGLDNGINGGADRICLFLSPLDYRKFQAYLAQANTIVGAEIIDGKNYSTVAGIPFAASALIIDGSPVFATNKAVRLIHSTCKNTESERDANVRLSTYYARDNYVAGLEFEKKALVMGASKAITKTAPSHGAFTVPAFSVANARVKIDNITPDAGYVIDAISVTDADSQAVTVDADNTFVMPAKPVTIAVTFKTA